MDELLKHLTSFQECLVLQRDLFLELLPVLDEEERLVAGFQLNDFERLMVIKDQIVRRAATVEKRRVQTLQRICFLVGYDARTGLPSLKEFRSVLTSYIANVSQLLPEETVTSLKNFESAWSQSADQLLASFQEAAPRIQRNKDVMTRLAKNFDRSVGILRQTHGVEEGYNSKGKIHSLHVPPEARSSVRVKV
jgi:flagellar biosynthesis/type III secretory pathway chaperone